jgi:DNA-binding transcriptional LysR family regulator
MSGGFAQNVSLMMLRTFVRVVEAGSTSAAARMLFIAQSNVSAHIASLTRLVGVPLLERINGRWEPTTAGSIVCRRAREVLQILDAADRDISAAASGYYGNLLLTATPAVADTMLADILVDFGAAHVEIQVDAKVASREEALHSLALGGTDAVLTALLEPRAGLRIVPFAKDELVIALPRDHRLSGRGKVDVSDIVDETFVGYDLRSAVPAFLRDRLGPAASSMVQRVSVNSNDALLSCVERGIGIAFVPRRIAERWQRGGGVGTVALRGVDLTRDLLLAMRSDVEPTSAVRALVEWLPLAYARDQARFAGA